MDDPTARLQEALGHTFADPGLLKRALIHRSAVAEGLGTESYERLEFLGDAVLGLAVAGYLVVTYPDLTEGEMAMTRASVVSEAALAPIAEDFGVGEAVVLGRGEAQTGGRAKPSILSDTLEALIGAVYLDGGFEAARAVVLRHWTPLIDERARRPGARDFKTRLQEMLAPQGRRPEYAFEERGPDHAKVFRVTVAVEGEVLGTGTGSSKKRAEQEAARVALERLG